MSFDNLSEALQSIQPDRIRDIADSFMDRLYAVEGGRREETQAIIKKYPGLDALIKKTVEVAETRIQLSPQQAKVWGAGGSLALVILAELADIDAMPQM